MDGDSIIGDGMLRELAYTGRMVAADEARTIGLVNRVYSDHQALLEGVLLFVLLWRFAAVPRARGAVSGFFLIGYGAFRFIAEYFRTPDAGIFGQSDVISMGQWLSLPMIVAGCLMLLWSMRKR